MLYVIYVICCCMHTDIFVVKLWCICTDIGQESPNIT